MFTGLVEAVGKVVSVSELGAGKEITFTNPFSDLEMGESVAVNGVCSTVVSLGETFGVQYLEESLKKTTIGSWANGDAVNLERCLTPTSRLGGHIMTGHVDGVGTLVRLDESGPWHEIEIKVDPKFMVYVIDKGSIAIEGISLTVVEVKTSSLTCHIIPHTFENTVLSHRQVGDMVNVEFDVIGKYWDRFKTLGRETNLEVDTIIKQVED